MVLYCCKKTKILAKLLLIIFFHVLVFNCPYLAAEQVTAGSCFDYLAAKLLNDAELENKDSHLLRSDDELFFKSEFTGFDQDDEKIEQARDIRRRKMEKVVSQTMGEFFLRTRFGRRLNKFENKIKGFSRFEYSKYAEKEEKFHNQQDIKTNQKNPKKIFGLCLEAHAFSGSNSDPSNCALELSSFYHDTMATALFRPIDGDVTLQFTKKMKNMPGHVNSATNLEFVVSDSQTQCIIKFGFDF
jgi:hypothetical protein